MTLIDLSHSLRDGLITYHGLPGPVIRDHLSREASRAHYAEDTEFQIGRIDMVANTGTYLDAPFHRYAEGKDLAEVPLSSLADLDGIALRVQRSADRAVGAEVFVSLRAEGVALEGKAMLIVTEWSRHWGHRKYFELHPYLTADAARFLVDAQVALVGIDSLNIDDTDDPTRPVHSILLAHEIPIVEHLTNLALLPRTGFQFYAVPVKIEGFGSFPVRAFAIVR